MGLHLPYLPLAIMHVNLPVVKILLVFSHTKVQIGVVSEGKKKPSGSLQPDNHNLISFVHGCEPYSTWSCLMLLSMH